MTTNHERPVMSDKLAALRKRIHDRMFAMQEATDDEMEMNGETSHYDLFAEEAAWLSKTLADLDEALNQSAPVDTKLNLVE